ncbi:MAG: PepSY-like domain-containing protein [Bacteroidia bacterium]
MKKIIILLLCATWMGASFAQEIETEEVPTAVKAAFSAKYPKAQKVEWEAEEDNTYEADFKLYKINYSASFDQTGKWLETETEIKVSELPEAVANAIKTNYPEYKIEEAELVETHDRGTVYEVDIEKGEEAFSLEISSTGTILKKEMEIDTDED